MMKKLLLILILIASVLSCSVDGETNAQNPDVGNNGIDDASSAQKSRSTTTSSDAKVTENAGAPLSPNGQQASNMKNAQFSSKSLAQNLETLKEQLREGPQTFVLDVSRDTLITGTDGTSIFIQANSFLLPNGEPAKGKVTINLIECYDLLSFYANKLSSQTVSNEILESGGSVNITAQQNGVALRLNSESPLEIGFPKPASQRDRNLSMETFYADSSNSNFVRWNDNDSRPNRMDVTNRGWSKDTVITETYVTMDTVESAPISWKFQDNGQSLNAWMMENHPRAELLTNFASNRGKATVKISFRTDGAIQEISSTRLIEQDFKDALYSWLKRAPKLDMEGVLANHPYDLKLEGVTYNRNMQLERFLKDQTDSNGRLNSSVRSEMIGKYLLSVTNLGWVNCDRYFNNTIPATVRIPAQPKTEFLLVSNDIQGVFLPVQSISQVSFNMVPTLRTYRLYAIKNSEEGLFFNQRTISVKGNETFQMEATIPVTLEELKEKIWFQN